MKRSLCLCLLLIVSAALSGCNGLFLGYDDLPADSNLRQEDQEVREIIPPGAIQGNIYLNLSGITLNDPVLNLHAKNKEEALKEVKSRYDFSLTVKNDGPSVSGNYILPDIIADQAEKLINEIYSDHLSDGPDTEYSYSLDIPYRDYAEFYANLIHDAWSSDASAKVITGYDRDRDEFVFGGGHDGYEVDVPKLTADIEERFNNRDFTTQIEAEGETVTVSADEIKDQYKELSSYETTTTNIAVRNKNVSLAADSINGVIVKPGEEFSYNGTVGKRTKEKGYGEAGAYLNGEVVQEIGGGVCQVSTTLYNAVFRAGLKSTERTSHTFAPAYVTPGLDATVSWEGPDYKFVNNSPYPVGIKAHYSNLKIKVSIFGVPLLPEGETWDLVSSKTATLGVPAPVYITSGAADAGSAGSIWEAYKVVYTDGEETARVFDHKSKYVGHTPRVYANPLIPPGMSPEEYNAAMAALAMQAAQAQAQAQ